MVVLSQTPVSGLPINFHAMPFGFLEKHDRCRCRCRPTRALVTSKLDFGNAALYGITGTLLHRLEMVQRAAARVVLGLRRRDQHSMTAALQQLHWLPVAYRIQFKLLTLVHGAIHANTAGADLAFG